MGVKSTQTLTRAAATSRYEDLHVRVKTERRRERQQARIDEAGHIGSYIPGLRTDADLGERDLAAIYHRVDARIREDGWRGDARAKVARMGDVELENALERLNDEANGGEGFENYTISEHGGDD